MAEVNLKIAGDPGMISAHALRTGVQQTVGLLDEYAHAMSERGQRHIRWNVRDLVSNGDLRIGFSSMLVHGKRKTPITDNSAEIAATLVNGISIIDRNSVIPPYISENGMRRVEAFVKVIDRQEAKSFTLTSQGVSASVTKTTGNILDKLVEIKRKAIGSVEGRLVGINVARNPRLSIIHHITRRAVTCVVEDRHMDLAKNALGKRVIVYGTLHKNVNGDTIRVDMRHDNLHIFAAGSMRAELEAISRLPVPKYAETKNTEDYLIETRGE